MLASLVDLDDLRVLQPSDRVGFGQETGPALRFGVRAGQDHLQRNHPVGMRLPGLINHAHAAPAQLAE